MPPTLFNCLVKLSQRLQLGARALLNSPRWCPSQLNASTWSFQRTLGPTVFTRSTRGTGKQHESIKNSPSIVAQKNSTTSSFLSLKLYSLAIPFLAPGKKLRRIRPFSWLHGKRLGCSPGFSLHQPKRIQRCEKSWENQRIRWLIIVFHSYLVAIFPMKKA